LKIVLATFGSRGDVQPMLALSLALKSKGHDVLLVAPPEKAAWAKQLGCPFHPLGSDVTAFIDSMEDAHSLRPAIRFVSFLRKELNSQFNVFPEIISGADLVIGSSLTFALSTLAEFKEIEYRFIAFAPQLLPSGYHPFPACKHQRFPKWYNRKTWQIAGILDRCNFTQLINNHRRQLGMDRIQDAWRNILGRHVIVATDREISQVPPDIVEPAVIQTGYMHLKHFPRMAAVIHHGGAGTTATAAISGVPQIIVPHLLDQYYWGYQIHQSRLGPAPIWRSRLTSKKLAAAIHECISNKSILQKAKETANRIKQQDSLEFSVDEILKSR
jgi:UDP:flavonoid glycosyltransferase YjiC (YdhE family)